MLNRDTNILITGVTGLIGGELVRKLVQTGVGNIYCVVRPSQQGDADGRLIERLNRSNDVGLLEAYPGVCAVAGNVTQPQFGLSRRDAEEVLNNTNLIIHCASELSFIRDESCRETNIAGMNNLIDIARRCRRSTQIVHFSTATICGNVSNRCVLETDGDTPNSDHYNEYTRSKAAAEQVLRDSGLPALVIRPSIVLSADLPAEQFARAILWFLPLLNEFDAVPIDPASCVDVIPVQYVVDSTVRLLQQDRLKYDCYHVSAGADSAMRCGDVAAYLDEFYSRSTPLQLIPPKLWTREMHREYVGTAHQRKLFATLKYYLPFLNMNVSYDNSRLREELGEQATTIPHVKEYIGQLLRLVTPELQADGMLTRQTVPTV